MKIWTLASLLLITSTVFAYPTDENGNIIIPPACFAKGDAVLFTQQYRDKIPLEKALQVLERDWKESYSLKGIKRATYIDMQRIVRDAYREDPISLEAAEEEAIQEIAACLHNGY